MTENKNSNNNMKSNGTWLLLLMCIATFYFFDMYSTAYDGFKYKAENYVENTETENTEKSQFELDKEEILMISELLNLENQYVSKIEDSDYFRYRNTSEKKYIETLEQLRNNENCEVIDNGIKNYTWYIVFKLEDKTNGSN